MSKETERIEKSLLSVVKTPKSASSDYSNRIFKTENRISATDGFILISAITGEPGETIPDKKFATKLSSRLSECTELFAEMPSEIIRKIIELYKAERQSDSNGEVLFRYYDRSFSLKVCIRALEFAAKHDGIISIYVPPKGDRKKSPILLKFGQYEIIMMPYYIGNEKSVRVIFDRVDFENAMLEYENHNYSLF